jgi:predicted Zn-dependent protease
MRSNIFKFLLSVGVILNLQGCMTTNPTTGTRVFTGGMTEQDEITLGRKNHPQMLKLFGGEYKDNVLKSYVSSVGNLLAQTVERRQFDYKFTILNSGVVNAFALPGGYIYISRGLLALAGNESEMAAVLAHELGHVSGLHHAQRQGKQVLANAVLTGVGIAAGKEVAQFGNIIASGLLGAWSREDEIDADTLSFRYLSRAGFDSKAIPNFLAKLRANAQLNAKREGKSPDSVDHFDYFGTHPIPSERLAFAEIEAQKYQKVNSTADQNVYLDKIDGMLFGDDPEQGFVRGRSFAHPKLRFQFQVPENYSLFNSPTSVIAKGPNKETIIFDQAKETADGPISFYLQEVWGKGISLENIENIDVNGLAAATAEARVRTTRGTRDLRMVAIRKDLQTVYRFAFYTEPGRIKQHSLAFRRVTHSFKILSKQEANSLKPLRIRIRTANSEDTVESFARKMQVDTLHRKEHFRVINGLGVRDVLVSGRKYKIIAD